MHIIIDARKDRKWILLTELWILRFLCSYVLIIFDSSLRNLLLWSNLTTWRQKRHKLPTLSCHKIIVTGYLLLLRLSYTGTVVRSRHVIRYREVELYINDTKQCHHVTTTITFRWGRVMGFKRVERAHPLIICWCKISFANVCSLI